MFWKPAHNAIDYKTPMNKEDGYAMIRLKQNAANRIENNKN